MGKISPSVVALWLTENITPIKLAWLSKTRRDPDTNTARRLLAKLHAIMIFLFCGYFITKYVFCARRFRLQSAYTSSKRPPTSLTLYCCHRFESDLQFTVSQGVPRSLFKPCGTLGGFDLQQPCCTGKIHRLNANACDQCSLYGYTASGRTPLLQTF